MFAERHDNQSNTPPANARLSHIHFAATKLLNSLPLSLRDPTLTLTSFCSRLQTHLFSMAYGRALVTA